MNVNIGYSVLANPQRPGPILSWTTSVWLQLRSNADVEALASFVKVKRTRVVLQQHARLQEMLFIKLHAWTMRLVNTEQYSLDVITRYLDACQICAQPSQLPALHYTWALAALGANSLELSLEHIDLVLKFNSEGNFDSPEAATVQCQRSLAGRLLKFKVMCMVHRPPRPQQGAFGRIL